MLFQTDYQKKGFALVFAAATGDVERVRACLDGGGSDIHFNDDLALRSAVFTGNFATLKVLVEKGANIHANKEEALLYAAKRGDAEIVGYLIGKGADVAAMLRDNPQEADKDCLKTIDQLQSKTLMASFLENFDSMKKALQNKKPPKFSSYYRPGI